MVQVAYEKTHLAKVWVWWARLEALDTWHIVVSQEKETDV